MSTYIYYANILLSDDFITGRMNIPTRKKGDWFHSISIFNNDKCINNMKPGNSEINCSIIHFYGYIGSPVLEYTNSTIKCVRIHKGAKIYKIGCWGDSIAVIGDVRDLNGYDKGFGKTTKTLYNIKKAAFEKWGNENIPYAHQRNESYNCVAFVDDILSWAKDGIWSERISVMHNKHLLYL